MGVRGDPGQRGGQGQRGRAGGRGAVVSASLHHVSTPHVTSILWPELNNMWTHSWL